MIINLNKLNGGQGGGSELEYIIVEQLPSSGKKGAIYLVQKETSTEGDLYDEYIWVNSQWEHIGTSSIDLSDYYTKEETDSTFATKGEIPTVPTNVSAFENDANYLTEHQSLEDYYTKDETDSTFATKDEIPTVPTTVSSFENDADYATRTELPTVPTNVSAFENDAQYITSDAIPTQVSAFENDANYLTEHQSLEDYYTKEETDSTFATKDELPTVPTNVSAFDNDAQYITLSDIPTQVSAFENDANYQTSTDVSSLLEPYATKDEIPTSTSQLSNDSGFITSDEVDAKIQDKADRTDIPTSTSQLTNDSDFITSSDIPYVPTNVSELDNDANYQTSTDVASLLEPYATKDDIPTSTSQLTNDSDFITSDEVDTKIVNKADKTELDALSDKVDELQLFKFPNATIFGTPTIQNGQVSNFSNTNYLQFPFLVDFQDREFIIDFSFTTPSDMSGQQNILDSNYGLAFAIRNGQAVMVASENGTSWTTGELISDEILSPNTTYYFKIMWYMGLFEFRGGLSKDDLSITKQTILAKTPYPKTMVIGRSYTEGGNYFKGSINLNDASLTISNKVVWTGMDDVGLATRAAVDLSNLDAKGVEVIDNRVETKLASQTITMVATLEDGTTVTYTLYGIEQQ